MMKNIVLILSLSISLLTITNVFAYQTTLVTPNSSPCAYEGPYDSSTGNFQCSLLPIGSGSSLMELPYSYIIFQNGTGYYSQNGQSGNIDFQSNDASTVIQNTWDRLSSGDLYLKNGTYQLSSMLNLSSTIQQKKNFIMSDSAYLVGNGDYEAVVKISGGNINSYYLSNINGGNHNVKGVKIQNTDGSKITIGSILGTNGSLVIDSTDNNNLGGNEIYLLSTNANGGNGIEFDSGSTVGSIQGNDIYFNFITGAKHGIDINVQNNNFAFNNIYGNAIDDAYVSNAYGIYVHGHMTGNIITIPFIGGNSAYNIGGDFSIGNSINAAHIENTVLNLGLQDNKVSIVGGGVKIINTANIKEGSLGNQINTSIVSGLSNFNNGIPLYSNKMVLGLSVPTMTVGQTKTFYFYNTLIAGATDAMMTSIINDGGCSCVISSTQTDTSWTNEYQGMITIRALQNTSPTIMQILVELNN